MNSRLSDLISRGYPKEIVEKLSLFTNEELDYASKCAFKHISRNCTPVNSPNAIFIGGQPGCGKTIMSMNLKNEIGNAIEIGIDNYRMYHPRYLEIEECIRKHWVGRNELINDTPGNDIADFTHLFAGAMTDKLIEIVKNKKYNMLLEWGMREPNGPINTMRDLKKEGYNNIVLFVATHKDISYEACNLRSNVMKNSGHIIRKVPKSFHDLCIETLPDSINEIYEVGTKEGLINYMGIVNRYSNVLWDNNSKESPGSIYNNYLNNKYDNNINNPYMSLKTNKNEMQGLRKELNKLKNDILYMNSHLFNVESKIK